MNLFGKKRAGGAQSAAGNGRKEGDYPSEALPAGTRAPDFELRGSDGETHTLAQYRGRPVILAFYPADWSPVCGDQMVLYNEVLSLFEAHNAQLLGISVDGIWSHRAFAEQRKLDFPLLADFHIKGQVARAYGVYQEDSGNCKRALFVIDSEGVIRWSHVSPPNVNPGADGVLKALESLEEREMAG